MQQLAGVFFHVNAQQADVVDAPAGRQRPIELRDLISLRQVGIKVILAGEDRAWVPFGNQGARPSIFAAGGRDSRIFKRHKTLLIFIRMLAKSEGPTPRPWADFWF